MAIEGADLIEKGRQFHRVGAAIEKARSPLRRNMDGGTSSIPKSADLRCQLVVGG